MGWLHIAKVAFLLLTQWPRVQFSEFPNIYFDAPEIYQRGWLEESGQSLETIAQTHLVLARGKLVLQRKLK